MTKDTKTKGILIIALLIMVFLNIFSLQHLASRNSNIKKHKHLLKKKQAELQIINHFISAKNHFEKNLADSINKDFLDSHNNNKPKIIVVFNEGDCKLCQQSILMDINCLSNNVEKGNIWIVGNYNNESFGRFRKGIEEGYKTILYKDLFGNKYNNFHHPIMLVLDSDLTFKHIFSPEVFPHLKDEFYKNILSNYTHL